MTTAEIRAKKNALRKKFKKLRSDIPEERRNELSDAMVNAVLSSQSYRFSKAILLYSAIGSEPSTEKIALSAIADGKAVYFPKSYDGGIMKFFRVCDLCELSGGLYGIKEPSESAEEYVPNGTAELCIVPGVCFDKSGYRIGYGRGYYDRFLAKFKGISAGFVYSELISDEKLVFEKRYDRAVDLIFTEKGVEFVADTKKI